MNNLKKSIMSVAMAAITAASPILSSYAGYPFYNTLNYIVPLPHISTKIDGTTRKAH